MPKSEPCLVVFARAPVAGQVKTRLFSSSAPAGSAPGGALTAEQAAAVHAAFVADVCCNGARSGIARRRLYVAGDLAHPQLLSAAGEHGYTLHAQAGADLGARMAAAIAAELAAGASAVLLIGTDSPTLPLSYLQQAAAWLHDSADVVLGPATDGGYYLIGARRPIPELFAAGVSWGTAQVLPTTLQRLRQLAQAGARVALLPFFYDVDTPQDLWLLACHLRLAAATAQEGAGDRETAQAGQAAPGRAELAGLAGPPPGLLTPADSAARSTLTALHAPATWAALAALGYLEPDPVPAPVLPKRAT